VRRDKYANRGVATKNGRAMARCANQMPSRTCHGSFNTNKIRETIAATSHVPDHGHDLLLHTMCFSHFIFWITLRITWSPPKNYDFKSSVIGGSGSPLGSPFGFGTIIARYGPMSRSIPSDQNRDCLKFDRMKSRSDDRPPASSATTRSISLEVTPHPIAK